MRFQYIMSAAMVMESEGTKVLCDPWLSDGIYYGSWFHYPPIKYSAADFQDIDYIYLSHVHPDHFDAASLSEFPKDVPIIILDYALKFLKQNIEKLGFKQIIEIKSGDTFEFGNGFQVEIVASHFCDPDACGKMFACDRWLTPDKRSQGIDSVAVFADSEHVVVNHNDAPYFPMVCDLILSKYPKIDVNMGVYAGAGSYPQCFDNLSDAEKLVEAENKKLQFIQMLEKYTRHLGSRYVFPFAGQYLLGGKLSNLNDYRGVADISEVGEYFAKAKGSALKAVSVTSPERSSIVQSCIDRPLLADSIIGTQTPDVSMTERGEEVEPYVRISLDYSLLMMILTRHAHWNNAEIGSHLSFFRSPDVYESDLFGVLSFIHL